MSQPPTQHPKQDVMKYFSRECAGVKLFALFLVVLMEWGKAAMYAAVPVGTIAWVIARHTA